MDRRLAITVNTAWITTNLGIDAKALRELGLRDAEDVDIYQAARRANVTVMTKDNDFVLLLERFGSPPKVILLTCGNTLNAALRKILTATLSDAVELLAQGESLVEIG